MCHAEDVAGFLGGRAEGPAQAQLEIGVKVAVAVNLFTPAYAFSVTPRGFMLP